DFIKGETAAGANLSTKTADYLREIQKVNTNQLVKVFDPKQNESKLNVFVSSLSRFWAKVEAINMEQPRFLRQENCQDKKSSTTLSR
ncbi:MAG: hypothetical protein E7G70_24010, partial [Serratia marcescens]|nr:hypothetical protein [Serratia marcescens]